MRTLGNHTLVYDNECPLCELYTGAFIQTGMLDSNGRESYAGCQLPIDRDRAKDEIALVNRETGEVSYGIESLFKVIGTTFPLLAILFRCTAFKWLMTKVYAFISFNRKVIAPARVFEASSSCTPAFNIRYRVAYIVFAWVVTSFILNAYSSYLTPLIPPSSLGREFAICAGQILFQSLLLRSIGKVRVMHYLGNMMTVSLLGALLLSPLMLIFQVAYLSSPVIPAAFFVVVVATMIAEHVRRTRIMKLGLVPTLGWVTYMLIMLAILCW